jgi:hypothetical protein
MMERAIVAASSTARSVSMAALAAEVRPLL